MTKSEQRKMRRLEMMVEEQRAAISRHLDVYREISLENIELRARIQHIEEVALALAAEIQGGRPAIINKKIRETTLKEKI